MKASNFKMLQNEFSDIIQRIEDKDKTGRATTISGQRKTILLKNKQKLYITEKIDPKNEIVDAWYDLHEANGSEVIKFHKHPHDDEAYGTETCPFHIQFPSSRIDTTGRLPNHNFRDLFHILEFIRLMMVVNKEY